MMMKALDNIHNVCYNMGEMKTTGFMVRGKPVEQVADGRFLIANDQWQIVDYSKEAKDLGYEPDKSGLIGKVVRLPTEAINFLDEGQLLDDLYKEIQEYINRYVEMDELSLEIVSLYVMLTWQYDQFTVLPYIRFIGDKDTGKSRATEVIGSICYKPMIISGAVGEAPIFRIIDQYKGTLVIDEADLTQADMRSHITKILNTGYKKFASVVRCQPKTFDLEAFNTFCPKILNSRELFGDDALESRCLTIRMKPKTRYNIPAVLPNEFKTEAEKMSNKLLFYRLALYDIAINKGMPPLQVEISRLAEVLYPLMIVGSFANKVVETYARKYRPPSLEDAVRVAIKSSGEPFISVSGLAQELGMKPVNLGKLLRKLGYEVKHGAKGNYILNEVKR
jgi:hypothetical protein